MNRALNDEKVKTNQLYVETKQIEQLRKNEIMKNEKIQEKLDELQEQVDVKDKTIQRLRKSGESQKSRDRESKLTATTNPYETSMTSAALTKSQRDLK